MKFHKIYFSAAGTTKKLARVIAEGFELVRPEVEVVDYPLIEAGVEPAVIDEEDMALFAVPVYAGRVPTIAAEQIRRFRGCNTRAILMVTYGNRAVDDALIELRDIAIECGFSPVVGAAFVATHSIFPKVAADRPDVRALWTAKQLGADAANMDRGSHELFVDGNIPYKVPGKGGAFVPVVNENKCFKAANPGYEVCGICAEVCPVGAIDLVSAETNSDLCIKCAHCIAECPRDAREWSGEAYEAAEKRFVEAYSEPQTNYFYYFEKW